MVAAIRTLSVLACAFLLRGTEAFVMSPNKPQLFRVQAVRSPATDRTWEQELKELGKQKADWEYFKMAHYKNPHDLRDELESLEKRLKGFMTNQQRSMDLKLLGIFAVQVLTVIQTIKIEALVSSCSSTLETGKALVFERPMAKQNGRVLAVSAATLTPLQQATIDLSDVHA